MQVPFLNFLNFLIPEKEAFNGDLQLTKGPVPRGRRASSVDFPVRLSLGGGGCAFLKSLPPPARSVHQQIRLRRGGYATSPPPPKPEETKRGRYEHKDQNS